MISSSLNIYQAFKLLDGQHYKVLTEQQSTQDEERNLLRQNIVIILTILTFNLPILLFYALSGDFRMVFLTATVEKNEG